MNLVNAKGRRCKLHSGMIMGLRAGKTDSRSEKDSWSVVVTDRQGQVFKFYRDDEKIHDEFAYPMFAAGIASQFAEGWFFAIINLIACTHGFALNYAISYPPGCVYAVEFV